MVIRTSLFALNLMFTSEKTRQKENKTKIIVH